MDIETLKNEVRIFTKTPEEKLSAMELFAVLTNTKVSQTSRQFIAAQGIKNVEAYPYVGVDSLVGEVGGFCNPLETTVNYDGLPDFLKTVFALPVNHVRKDPIRVELNKEYCADVYETRIKIIKLNSEERVEAVIPHSAVNVLEKGLADFTIQTPKRVVLSDNITVHVSSREEKLAALYILAGLAGVSITPENCSTLDDTIKGLGIEMYPYVKMCNNNNNVTGTPSVGMVNYEFADISTLIADVCTVNNTLSYPIELNVGHKTEIQKDGIIVGCQTFPHSVVASLRYAVNTITGSE